MLIVMNSNGRPRYIRFIVTNSGSSATQGPHQVAQRFTRRYFFPSFFASASVPASLIVCSVTGAASHFAREATASFRLSDHFVEQPKTRVFGTGTSLPARSASTALIASCDFGDFTSPSSNRPT